jgi:hypothetical protein
VDIRFYIDPETGLPHIHRHGIREVEVEEVMHGPGEDLAAKNNARMKLGQSGAGRYIQVVYVPDDQPESVFVITAYELQGKSKQAFRRRQRRKRK